MMQWLRAINTIVCRVFESQGKELLLEARVKVLYGNRAYKKQDDESSFISDHYIVPQP